MEQPNPCNEKSSYSVDELTRKVWQNDLGAQNTKTINRSRLESWKVNGFECGKKEKQKLTSKVDSVVRWDELENSREEGGLEMAMPGEGIESKHDAQNAANSTILNQQLT